MDAVKTADQICREQNWTYVGQIARDMSIPYNVADFIVRTYCKAHKVKKADVKAAGITVATMNIYKGEVRQTVADRIAKREAKMRDAVEVSVRKDVVKGEFDDLAREVAQIHEDSRSIADSLSRSVATARCEIIAIQEFRVEVERFMRDMDLKVRGLYREIDSIKESLEK